MTCTKHAPYILHGLEVVCLLDLGLPLLAHRRPQLLPLVHGLEGLLRRAGQVDGLLLQRYLGRERLNVARGEDLRLEDALALGGDASLFLGFG